AILDAVNYTNVIDRNMLSPPTFAGISGTPTEWDEYHRMIGRLGDMVLAAGVLNNHVLVPALAGFNACIKIHSVWSNTADTYSLTFQDEDDVTLTGMPVVVDFVIAANNTAVDAYGMTGFAATVNDAIEVDIAGGAGVEVLYLAYEFWYETI
ncbi:unnamed protein product, partial [marine sediment metagenome]